ncbi:DNA polymerase III subunit delta [Anaplasma phagocytophilum str. Norway variant1]|uniref:DNA-directed DNA polymerase n=1 Tax=Anaplasma phagocytophilum str. Norway variant1 TaxID=1392506 RepID=A0A7H9E0Q5_ANAPH|nr:DNA polymerase III subunit delta [Anaplasma phagocytophilum str. Norway variant1]
MKVTASKLKDFFSNPGAYGSVLLYGNDYSRISHYTQKIINLLTSKEEFSVLRTEFSHASKEPEQLFVDLSTVPMFHQKSLVILTDAKDSLSPDLRTAVDNLNTCHCYVIVQAKELSSTSSLRTYYNNHVMYAAIACYKEDNINNIVAEFLAENQVTYNTETFALLCNLLQTSNACIQPELEKLLLYLGTKRNLSIEDLQESFAADFDPALDDICIAIADGNLKSFNRAADALLQNKIAAVLIIRSSIKYFMTLEYLLRKVRSGCDINTAVKSVQPPIFFRLVAQLKKHVSTVPYQMVQLILRRLHEAEVQCKLSDSSQESMFRYLMYSLILSVQQIRR